jgi:hypothetical protein
MRDRINEIFDALDLVIVRLERVELGDTVIIEKVRRCKEFSWDGTRWVRIPPYLPLEPSVL